MLSYLENPENIDFDDDISLLLSSIIKLSEKVTDTCKVLFPCTVKIHAKYDGVFGNLLQSLNRFLYFGADWVGESQDRVRMLHEMAMKSMFYNAKRGLCKTSNSDGCILLQLNLYSFKETEIYNDFFQEALEKSFERMKILPMNVILKSVLMGNVLCGFIYNADATLTFLKQNDLAIPFLEELN